MTVAPASRIRSIDMVKTLAMLMVIGTHSIYVSDPCKLSPSWLEYNIFVPVMPLFFICTGYLLLGRDQSKCTSKYILRKILGCIRIIMLICITLTAGIYLKYGANSLTDITNLLTGAIVSTTRHDGRLYYLWFLWAYALIYALYPALNIIYNKRVRLFNILTACGAALLLIVFILNITIQFEYYISQALRIWNWLFYFMLGGVIHRYKPKVPYPAISLGITATAALVSMYLIYPVMGLRHYEYFYSSPLTIAYSCCLFVVCLNSRIAHRLDLSKVSVLFMPVYLIHPIVILIIQSYAGAYLKHIHLGLFLCTSVTTIIISVVIMKIKPIRALLTL